MYYNYFNYKETPEDTIFLVKFSKKYPVIDRNELVSIHEIVDDFNSYKKRLKILGYDKLKINLYINFVGWTCGEWVPEKFMMILKQDF